MVLWFMFVAKPVLVKQDVLVFSAKPWFYPAPRGLEVWEWARGWEETQDATGYPILSCSVLRCKSSGQDEEGTFRVKVFVFLTGINVLRVPACLGGGEHLPPDGKQGIFLYLHTQLLLFLINLPLSHSTSLLAFLLCEESAVSQRQAGWVSGCWSGSRFCRNDGGERSFSPWLA